MWLSYKHHQRSQTLICLRCGRNISWGMVKSSFHVEYVKHRLLTYWKNHSNVTKMSLTMTKIKCILKSLTALLCSPHLNGIDLLNRVDCPFWLWVIGHEDIFLYRLQNLLLDDGASPLPSMCPYFNLVNLCSHSWSLGPLFGMLKRLE